MYRCIKNWEKGNAYWQVEGKCGARWNRHPGVSQEQKHGNLKVHLLK